MCWMTQFPPVKLIAKKAIRVQKVLTYEGGSIFYSPYRRMPYERGVTETSELGELTKDGTHYEIRKGLHSCETLRIVNHFYHDYYIVVNSFDDLVYQNSTIFENVRIFDAIIPEGAEYYVNERGDYVSNKLMIL